MRVPVVADGMYAGSRALKGFASNGLGSGFLRTTRENCIRVTTDEIPVNVFAVMDEDPSAIRRGLDAKAVTTARRNALKLARTLAPLDHETLWASKSLLKTPTARAPEASVRSQWAANNAYTGEVFAKLLHEVGLGRPSHDVLRELLASPDPEHVVAAVRLVRVGAPAVPDWYWHPGLAIPPEVEDQVAEVLAGERPRVSFFDEGGQALRVKLLQNAKLVGDARTVANAELRNAGGK